MIKCICIDGYNTIEDGQAFRQVEPKYFNKIGTLIGCSYDDIRNHIEFFNSTYGNFIWEYHEIFWRSLVLKYIGKTDDDIIDKVYESFLEFYEEFATLFDGVIETIEQLSRKTHLVLVANGNSKRLRRLIHKYKLNNYFLDFVISSETPYQKPDRFMFEYALKMYNYSPKDVIMVGDKYDNDIMGAQKCGMLTAILSSKNTPPSSYKYIPDFTIDRLADLNEIVEISSYRKLHRIDTIKEETTKSDGNLCGFIVAGGTGSRLGDVGKKTHKSMLLLWGRPMLYYNIMALKNAGCKKIVIAVSYLADQIINYFGDGSKFGINICYSRGEFCSTYDALYKSLDILSERIIYSHANILFQNKLLENIITLGNLNNKNVLAVIPNKNQSLSHAKINCDSNGKINAINLKEKENEEFYPYTFLGVAYYKKEDFLKFYDGNQAGMVEKIIAQLINHNHTATAYVYDGGWKHIETALDYSNLSSQSRWDIYYD